MNGRAAGDWPSLCSLLSVIRLRKECIYGSGNFIVKEGFFVYLVFRDLAIIILSAKFFGLVARKCKAPQVVGEIIAGLLIGPCILNLVQTSDAISTFAEIGVVMLMFTIRYGI